MRNFGYFVLIVGVLCLAGTLAMDVSVASSLGRVNNLGLMAERQNYTIIGGVMLIAGLLMITLRRRQSVLDLNMADNRACPICAEAIKNAAIKCKHCGAEVYPNLEAGSASVDAAVQTTTINLIKDVAQAWKVRGALYAMTLIFIVICAVSSNLLSEIFT